MHMFTKYHENPIQVTKNKNNTLNTRTPNTNQSVTFNPALRHEHHTIKFARPNMEVPGVGDVALSQVTRHKHILNDRFGF